MRALQISAYGNPSEVLRLAEIPETGAPGAGEVLIEIELAPLNKHDLLFMRGYFGGPVAPTVVGNTLISSPVIGLSRTAQTRASDAH